MCVFYDSRSKRYIARLVAAHGKWRQPKWATFYFAWWDNKHETYFNDLCKPIDIYTSMLGKSTQLQVIPQQSTQNAANLPLKTCDKSQWTFLYYTTRASTLALAIILWLGSFAKVSVQSIIPWSVAVLIVTSIPWVYLHVVRALVLINWWCILLLMLVCDCFFFTFMASKML